MSEEKKETVTEDQVAESLTPNPAPESDVTEAAVEAPETTGKTSEPKSNGEFEEIVIKLEDLEEEKEYPAAEMETLTKLYNKTMSRIEEGEIVNGRILNITSSDVFIDIGFKSEGVVPKDEFDNIEELKPGDEVEVFLETLEDRYGQLSLSKKRADFIRIWEQLVDKYENDEIIPGTITRRIKGGMVVNVMGVDAFLPGSQIDVKPIRDFDSYLNRELNLKIVKVNHARRNIVVSSRVLIEKEMESQRSEILGSLDRGQKRMGTVKNITDFGVFIDLGGVDGLLHITDLSWGRVNHPSELVKLDQEIEVLILDFNEQKDRISLGLKQLQPHPWENVDEKYPVDSVIKGRVVSLTDYGAFIELEKGIEGLIHISEMSWSQHIKHPSQILTVGQEIDAVVLNIEAEQKKISLGLKQLEPDPWEKIEERYPVGSVHNGAVRNLTQFGAFVELEEGIDGLVHISDLSWTKKVRHPSEIVKKGDEIEVVVLGINREERRIALGHKQIEANPWDSFEDSYKLETETKGKVSRIIDKGMIITLPMGVDGFIPNQHIGLQKGQKSADVYEIGSDVPAKVIEFDKENKKIVLSISAYFKDKERKEFEDYMAAQGVAKATVGEVAKTKDEKATEKKEEKTDSKPKAKKKQVKEEVVAKEKAETVSETAEQEAEAKPETETPADSDNKKDAEQLEKAETVPETAEKGVEQEAEAKPETETPADSDVKKDAEQVEKAETVPETAEKGVEKEAEAKPETETPAELDDKKDAEQLEKAETETAEAAEEEKKKDKK